MSTIQDKIELRRNSQRKKLYNNKIKLLGTESRIMRLRVAENKYGDEEVTLLSNEEMTVYLSFPADVPLNRYRDVLTTNENIATEGIYLFDILPIELFCDWNSDIEKGDFIVYKTSDVKSNLNIKMLLRVSEILGQFRKTLLYKKYNVAPYNGIIDSSILTIINSY